MNNLDVHVLQSFTRKLAYAAEKMAGRRPFNYEEAVGNTVNPATMGMAPGVKLDPPPSGSPLNAKPLPSGVDTGPGTTSGAAALDPPRATANADLDLAPNPVDMSKPGAPGTADVTTTANPSSPSAMASDESAPSWMDFLSNNAGSIGAAGAGGLGAMALARLFNSSKDDEEESSWAPWLAGAAGAGLGYGAWNYGPQLAEALSGMMGSGADKAAPQPPA